MSLKQKFDTAMTKIKENSPAIIGTLVVACTTVSALYIHEKRKLTLAVTHDDLDVLNKGYSVMVYDIDGKSYKLSGIGNDSAED
jgi:hypothetical protein